MNEFGLSEETIQAVKKTIEEVRENGYQYGLHIGTQKMLRIIFEDEYELEETCHNCRANRHEQCSQRRTFLFVELEYSCNCSCRNRDDLQKRIRSCLDRLKTS